MQIHVLDSSSGFVEARFVTIFVLHKKFPSTSTVRFFRILTYRQLFIDILPKIILAKLHTILFDTKPGAKQIGIEIHYVGMDTR